MTLKKNNFSGNNYENLDIVDDDSFEMESFRDETEYNQRKKKNKKRISMSSPQHFFLIKHFSISIIITFLVYLFIYIFDEKLIFLSKFDGLPQMISVMFFLWAISILVAKSLDINKKISETAHFFQKYNLYVKEKLANLNYNDRCQRIIDECIYNEKSKFAISILNLFEYGKKSPKIEEIRNYLIDENNNNYDELETSYSLIRVLLWTMPIIGFIGTVLGVGQAVGGFGSFLSSANDISEIKNGLTGVTSGLGIAFDSTLIALLLSVLLMIVTSSVEQFEINQIRNNFYKIQYMSYDIFSSLPLPTEKTEQIPPHQLSLIQKIEELIREMKSMPVDQNKLLKIVKHWNIQMDKSIQSLVKDWQQNCNKIMHNLQLTQKENKELLNQKEKILSDIIHESAELRNESKLMLTNIKELLDKETQTIYEIVHNEKSTIQELMESQKNSAQKHIDTFQELQQMLTRLIDIELNIKNEIGAIKEKDSLTNTINAIMDVLKKLDPALNRFIEKPLDVNVQFSSISSI